MSENEITNKQIWFGVSLVVLLIGGYIGADFLLSFSIRDNKKQLNISTSSEYPDYSSLKDLKKLVIVENFQSWTPNSDPKTFKSIERMILEKGNITKGYIYVKTSINNKAFSSWESIYMKMNDNGGHLFRPNSLPVPKSDKTELLFALNNIFYLPSIPYSETKTPEKINWFDFFKDNKKIKVYLFISSLKPALIEEITLYYDYVSDSNCSLIVQ